MAGARTEGLRPGNRPPPRYIFALNPYTNDRFSVCPRCKEATAEVITALVLYVAPGFPLTLRYACRFCAACDLLIAHHDELDRAIDSSMRNAAPEVVGQNYRVIGTMDLADWERSRANAFTTQQLQECLYPFRQELELIQGRAPGDDAPLPGDEQAVPADRWQKSMRVPTRLRPVFEAITRLTDACCAEHLTEEYAELCRALAAALCRKRPSPLSQGKPETWACAIAYTIGSLNFLFDKSQNPHMRATDLCKQFGISQSTGSARSKVIRDALKLDIYDARWCLPSKLDQHPTAWLIEVDGFPVDARYIPRAVQQEALRRGLIPYLPGTR